MRTLLGLHGHSLNGALTTRQLAPLQALGVDLLCPDAPHACTDAAVERLYAVWDAPRQPGPHRTWWDTSSDGRVYAGWEASRDLLVPLLAAGPIGIIGFSQGATLATALAAMSEHGLIPRIDHVIVIAGRTPRADVFAPFLARPLRTPSLHIWGEGDPLVGDSCRELVERYAPETREVVTWPGGHEIPTRGAAWDAIVRIIDPHVARSPPLPASLGTPRRQPGR